MKEGAYFKRLRTVDTDDRSARCSRLSIKRHRRSENNRRQNQTRRISLYVVNTEMPGSGTF